MKLNASFFATDSGEEPVRTWFRSLSKDDRKSMGIAVMRVQFGWPVGRPLCAPLGEGLYEIRQNLSDRRTGRVLFCFHGDSQIVLLNAFIKKTQKTPPGELALARKRMASLLRKK